MSDVESRYGSDKLWNLDRNSTIIPRQIDKCRHLLCLDVRADTWYPSGLTRFNQFAETPDGHYGKMLFQLFLKMAEMAAEEAIAPPKEKKDKKRKPNAPRPLAGLGSDNESEGEDLLAGGDQQNDDEQGETNPVNVVDDNPVELYLEQIVGKQKESSTPLNGFRKELISGYRWWLIIRKAGINPDAIFSQIMKDNERDKKKFRKRVISGQDDYWKKCFNRFTLVELAKWYAGDKFVANNRALIDSRPLESKENPIRASNLFNPYWINRQTGTGIDSIPPQSTEKLGNYFDRNTEILSFPCRKYVIKIPLSDINQVRICNKITPEHQKHDILYVNHMLPMIATEFITKQNEDKDVTRILSNMQNLMDKPDFFEKSYSDDETEDPMDLDLKRQEALESKREIFGSDYDSDDDEQEQGIIEDDQEDDYLDGVARKRTKRDVLNNSAIVFGIEGVEPEDLRNKNSLGGMANFQTAIDLANSGHSALYASVTSRAVAKGIRNQNFIAEYIIGNKLQEQLGIELINKYLVARKLYIMNQNIIFEEHKAWKREKSDASPAFTAIIDYTENTKLYENFNVVHEKMDITLSSFSNLELRNIMAAEHVYFAGERHKEFNIVWKNCLDALELNYDKIHSNTLLQSDFGGVGKSWLWHMVEHHWLIHGTVCSYNYQTLRSDTTDDRNQNGYVIIFDELEGAMMDKRGKDDKERSWKQKLSQNKVMVKAIIVDENFNRKVKIYFNDAITIYLCSTNANLESMSGPMLERFHVLYFDIKRLPRRSLLELQASTEGLTAKEMILMKTYDRKKHLIQALVLDVELLLAKKGLAKISNDVALIMLNYITRRLVALGYREPNPRMLKRVITSARLNCMLDAFEKLFFAKGAKYNGKGIKIDYMKDLDPLLYITSDHLIAAVGELIDFFIDPVEPIVKKAIKTMFGAENKRRNFKMKVQVAIRNDADSNSTKSVGGPRGLKNGGLDLFHDYDYNYMQFRINSQKKKKRAFMQQIYSTISSMMVSDKTIPFKPSMKEISDILKIWKRTHVNSPNYVVNDKTQIPKPEIPLLGPSTSSIQILEYDQHNVYISYHWIMCDDPRINVQYNDDDEQDQMDEVDPAVTAGVPLRKDPNGNIITKDANGNTIVKDNNGNTTITDPNGNIINKEKTPEEVLQKIIKEFFSKRHQHPRKFIWVYDEAVPYIRKILEVEGNTDPDADMLIIPLPNHIQKQELTIIQGQQEDFISAARSTSDQKVVDCDIDIFGANQRLLQIYRSDGTKQYKIDAEIITRNILRINNADSAANSYYMDDDDYDENSEGYFLGDPVDNLFTDAKSLLENMTDEEKLAIYEELDEYDEEKIKVDWDFNPEDYFIGVADNGVTKRYHWDYLEGVFIQVSGTESKTEQKAIFKQNCLNYAKIAFNPRTMMHLDILRNYYTEDERKNLFIYPGTIKEKAKKTLIERWENVNDYKPSQEEIAESLDKGNQFLTYRQNKQKKVVRSKTNPYCVEEYALTNEAMDKVMQ